MSELEQNYKPLSASWPHLYGPWRCSKYESSHLQEASVFILPSLCKFHFIHTTKQEKKDKEWKKKIQKEANKSDKEIGENEEKIKKHRFEKRTKKFNSANFTRTVSVYPKVIKLVSDGSFSSLCSLTKKDMTLDHSKPTNSHFHIHKWFNPLCVTATQLSVKNHPLQPGSHQETEGQFLFFWLFLLNKLKHMNSKEFLKIYFSLTNSHSENGNSEVC